AEPGPPLTAPHLPEGDLGMVARALWTQSFCEALDQRLTQISSLSDSRKLVMLAATIPVPAARSALQRSLVRHWYESPGTLFGPGWPQGCRPEPGLIFVLKSLPHRNVTAQTPGKVRATAAKPTKSTKPGKLALRNEHAKQDQIAEAWLHTSESVVREMMERFRAAAMARKIDRHRFAEEAADAPVSLQPEAEIVAAFAMDLPGAAL